MTWHSVHVYYHDDLDPVLLDSVRPLWRSLAATSATEDVARQAYFLRHWRLGPHVRLNFHCAPDLFRAEVRPKIDEIVGGYLLIHPAERDLDPGTQLPLHKRLAEMEAESGPLSPWRPNNTVAGADYDDRQAILGSAAAADLLADFYVATTELAFDTIEHVRSGGSRLGLAFDLLIATAHAFFGDGVERGFVSFRSHAEAFLAGTPDGDRLRGVWDRQYSRGSERLAARVRTVAAAVDADASALRFPNAWITALTPLELRAKKLIASGDLTVDPPTTRSGEPPAFELSRFHQELAANERWRAEVGPSAWFAAYRLVLNWTYLHLTRVGVTPVDRFLLCHLAANAVEEAYGVSAIDLVKA